ncbi:MAG: ribose 5-phosphate isomerase B [Bacillota bacterium]
MKLVMGSDHGGYRLKEELKAYLSGRNLEVTDVGTGSEDAVDYPGLALVVAEGVASGEYDRGILVCGTGVGMCMAANKVPGVRAALCHDVFSARASRAHNDANVLTLGARVIGPGLARAIVDVWLEQAFEGGRHARRVEQIRAIDEKYRR